MDWIQQLLNPRYGNLWLALAILCGLMLYHLLRRKPDSFPYEKQPGLFTATELYFLKHLQCVIQQDYLIFGKVRIADIIRTRPGLDNSEKWRAFNKISAKHMDFVICNKETLDIIGTIELDDSSHQRPDRILRDQFVDAALGAANVPILHVPVQPQYDLNKLQRELSKVLNLKLSQNHATPVTISKPKPKAKSSTTRPRATTRNSSRGRSRTAR